MAPEVRVPITPAVLAWAMAESGYEPGSFGKALEVRADQVGRWLDGSERPTLGQFRKLAQTLRRPTATFLLPAPPREPRPVVAFRHPPGESDRELQTGERHRIREVARLQRVAEWLGEQLGEDVARLPKVLGSEDPERAGERMRGLLGIGTGTQLAWRTESEALGAWRRALEGAGILVFFLPMGEEAARGFSLFSERSPAIAVNTHWSQTARIFTLMHELAHLLTRTNSICAEVGHAATRSDGDLERWCERAAAAALMPPAAVSAAMNELGEPRANLTAVGKLARKFKVSLRAATLRLVTLGMADWSLYAGIPSASDAKSGGGGGGGRKRPKIRVDEYGRRTTALVMRGLEREVICPAEAMSFLGVSYGNLAELRDMI